MSFKFCGFEFTEGGETKTVPAGIHTYTDASTAQERVGVQEGAAWQLSRLRLATNSVRRRRSLQFGSPRST